METNTLLIENSRMNFNKNMKYEPGGSLGIAGLSSFTVSENSKRVVYVTRPDIPSEAINLLKTECDVHMWTEVRTIPREELLKNVVGKDALYCLLTEKIDAELLEAAGPKLKVVGTLSAGYDHIDLKECKKRNILVGYTPDVLTDAVAELTIALLLATSRRLFEASAEVTNGGWLNKGWSPLYMCGSSLTGSTVGIFGMGKIGQATVERVKAFKPKQILYNSRSKKEVEASFVDFDELLCKSDFLILCSSLNHETKEVFDERAFKLMKSNAIFINTSRGGIVNHDALYKALVEKEIQAAGLDVMTPEPLPIDHPLTKLSNCVLIPHIGSATVETRTTMAILTSQNILSALNGSSMPASVF
ncbi:glyoxylate reductase/hydroxypyruvate reductase-like isoform X2 [Tachypleus tridentatus]|uniref:glyoxylate reductase/hydroxypyruvate reductase-like isoform X2 n=1 Tax=Tachypleus tridentatus TaxID=6853 RepID=UPI003FD3FE14